MTLTGTIVNFDRLSRKLNKKVRNNDSEIINISSCNESNKFIVNKIDSSSLPSVSYDNLEHSSISKNT